MKIRVLFAVAFGAVVQSGIAAADQAVSQVGRIRSFETGWAVDSIAVTLDVPTVNPTNPSCQTTDAGYALDPNDPGVRVHEAAIMGAYFGGKRVFIRVDGCVFGKPRIIAVGVLD
jgi:hypothetical protein